MKWLSVISAVAVGAITLGFVLLDDDDPSQPIPANLPGRAFASIAVERNGEPQELLPNTQIEVSFREPGVIRWDAGCNQLGSNLEILTESLRVEDRFEGTLMGCPGGLAAQETRVSRFLIADPKWQLDGNLLTLTDDKTQILLRQLPGVVFNAEPG